MDQNQTNQTDQEPEPQVPVVYLPKGSLIHFGGFPFSLCQETACFGTDINLSLAMEWKSYHRR